MLAGTKVDIKGTPILVGSNVVFGMGGSMTLLRGVVVKLNPKTVTVKDYFVSYHWRDTERVHPIEDSRTSIRAFDNVVVV